MSRQTRSKSGERGSTLIEFTVVAAAYFTMLLAICAGSNLYFTHNALVEATRRGARYAATQAAASPAGTLRNTNGVCDSTGPSLTAIRNYAIYGNTAGTGTNLVGLQPANVCIEYSNFGVAKGSVSVSITGYTFYFVVPGINRQITMPAYRSSAAGESAGTCPAGASPCT
jgi:Flp pilus assembly protein TadG